MVLASEPDWLGRVVGGQHELEVLDDEIGVVVGLHEPVCLIEVSIVSMLEAKPGKPD